MSDGASAAGKASKKNAKRQAARAKKRLLQDVEAPEAAATPAMVSVASTSAAPQPSSRARAPNRLEVLRSEMAAAKAAGDGKKTQELREQIWLLNDQAAGQMGEGFERAAAQLSAKTEARAAANPSTGAPPSEPEKRLRALNKRLVQIEKIKAAKLEGKKLEEGQLSKLAAEDEIRKEMVSIEELMSKAALL